MNNNNKHPYQNPFFNDPFFNIIEFKKRHVQEFEDLSDEEFEELLNERMKLFNKMEKLIRQEHYQHIPHENKKERLQPLSIRIQSHTKKFLKEESKLTPREILEIYEEYITGNEAFRKSLEEEETELKKELEKVRDKLREAKLFKKRLEKIEENKKHRNNQQP